MMDDDDGMLQSERLQIQLIRELDMEELEVEEVDDNDDLSTDEDVNNFSAHADAEASSDGSYTFDTTLASMHTYLGEIEDTHGRMMTLDGGVTLTLPVFYLEGVVLFPEATLPLRVIDPRLKAAVERALNLESARYTIAVVRILRRSMGERPQFAKIGTTAEIRQFKRLNNGSLNLVARGQQRFYLQRCWIDADGVPCADIKVIDEDKPLRTPKVAFAQLASLPNPSCSQRLSHVSSSYSSSGKHLYEDEENDWENISDMSPSTDHSLQDIRLQQSLIESPGVCERSDYCASSDEDSEHGEKWQSGNSLHGEVGGVWKEHNHESSHDKIIASDMRKESTSVKQSRKDGQGRTSFFKTSKCSYRAPMSFWPHWVYQMYDSYFLAQRAADMWKQIIGAPNMNDFVSKPNLLSFHIASKLPLSESTRQELLEIHGVSYRLQKEIQLLECFNHVRCKSCRTLIGKRSDMVVMSSDGPLNAYVNPYGHVHEIVTVSKANGLALLGSPVKEHSWFPGYAWTIANCGTCASNMGWLFTSTKKGLQPRSFWGIRSSQVVDDTC